MGDRASAKRLNVTLDDVHAEKLRRLAERAHVSEGALARSLLTTALGEADPGPRNVAALLDRIPGAFDSAQRGLAEVERGEGEPLAELS